MNNKKITRTNSLYRKKRSPLILVLTMVAIAAVIALIVAGCWQKLQNGRDDPSSKPSSSKIEESSTPDEEPSSVPDKEDNSQSASSESSSSGSSTSSSSLPFATVVPSSSRVDSSYFDDAAFVGDSLTSGIKSYELMKNATIIANTGINPQTIMTSQKIKVESGYVTALEALKLDNPKKIYIMLGANGMAWFPKDQLVSLYEEFLVKVKAQHPQSIIYIQSILPVTAAYSSADNNITNQKIDEYNLALSEMAKKNGVYFVNVAEALKDSTGALPSEASPKDGMHFGPTYYNKWFDYLKTHTINDAPPAQGNPDASEAP